MSVLVRILDGIGHVTIDNPPVNATSQAVRAGLMSAIAEMDAADVSAVVLDCAGRTFIAGADVREFGKPPVAPILPDVVLAIETAKVPWIAAIHGVALGGGLEVALGCAYRIAAETAKLGVPEVTLGLIPGAGGTVRLPRLIGAEAALDMIATGRPVDAGRALAMGLVDRSVSADDLTQAAFDFARDLRGAQRSVPITQRDTPVPADSDAWQDALRRAKARAKGQNAIIAAADMVEFAVQNNAATAFAEERRRFAELKADPQSAALRHMFFAERNVGKSAQGAQPRAVDQIGVIGGGTMGSGIAAACLLAGLHVTMIERDAAAAEVGQDRVLAILGDAEKRDKLTQDSRFAAQARFAVAADYSALKEADLVIEAVFEDMEVKRNVFAELDKVTRKDTILASNTSYLDIENLALGTAYPERVIGLHFFSPAHVMKLIEVIVPASAASVAIATGLALGKRLGKISVPAGVCDGFIGNRVMSAYRREADYMIIDGVLPHEVDQAMREFGFPIGVFQMQDLAGLDIAWAMRKRQAATRPPKQRYVNVADALCAAGRFGRKAGKGWYDYTVAPKGAVDPDVTKIILAESELNGIQRQPLTSQQIMNRLLQVMQSEGRAILAEGIAETPDAIDVVMVNGYGFPRWRGGPMFMATQD